MNKMPIPPTVRQGEHKILLASGSPRRRELCTAMGLTFTIRTSDADESIEAGTPPREAVKLLSRRKAEAVLPEEAIVIAADTVVALGDTILGKPQSEAEARAMLSMLSGKTHAVYTGVTVAYRGKFFTEADETLVTFRTLTEAEIATYVATGEPMDKAGAYGIQGKGGALVSAISGEFDNVVGLPCRLLAALLQKAMQ